MNNLSGKIVGLMTSGNLTLVDVAVSGVTLTAITIGTPENARYLHPEENQPIEVLFNESEVSIGKDIQGRMSLSNQLDCIIEDITSDEIFSQVHLSFDGQRLTSLITSRSVARLELQKGDRVTAFIKTNEVLLKEPDDTEIHAD